MELLFCASQMPLSKIIRWSLEEPVSHFAICFDDKVVIHSDLLGVGLKWYDDFIKSHQIVYKLKPKAKLDLVDEEDYYQEAISTTIGKPYDFKEFFYFGYRALLKKFFNKPFPSKSSHEKSGEYLCTELAKAFGLVDKSVDVGIISPFGLYRLFLSTTKYEIVK